MSIDCFQVNLNKAFAAGVILKEKLSGKKNFVAFLTEPYTGHGLIAQRPANITCIPKLSQKEYPRAGIFCSKNLEAVELTQFSNRDCAAGLINIEHKKAVIASVYCDINKEVMQGWLADLLTFVEKKKYLLVLGMDTNAHSTLFVESQNTRGNDLEDLIARFNLRLENNI